MEKSYNIGPRGTSGELALCWRDEVDIQVKISTYNIMDYEFTFDHQPTPIYIGDIGLWGCISLATEAELEYLTRYRKGKKRNVDMHG